ncbi:MAG: pyridoxamine 5'-phosphate oxidase [Pseudonocardiales bacterium]|nr:MAG: pyridoxamine 5'-phosphate oxidase [Pseudonocardiales bacterium]
MRRSYESAGLDVAGLAPDWVAQLDRWMGEAITADLVEPNWMVLATADAAGRPSARCVLLKGYDGRGLVLFTNYDSRKGLEATANPHASLVVPWVPLQRQVVVVGSVERTSAAESDAYFAVRPHGSQIGAAASPQSQVVGSRAELDAVAARMAAEYPEGAPVPRPAHWGGLRIVPETVEFWQGRRDRMHDRLRYRRTAEGWVVERLAP